MSDGTSLSFWQRLRRLRPHFAGCGPGIGLVVAGAIIGGATEAAVPMLMQPLLDHGFKSNSMPLWVVPAIMLVLFLVRGVAGFMAQYGLSWTLNRSTLHMRELMFDRLMRAEPSLFTQRSASSLINTLTHEVQGGASQLVYSLLALVQDSLKLVYLLAVLLFLNWQLTLFVAVLVPAIAMVMRMLSKRLHRLTLASQDATNELAYVVEENVLAWRIVRLHDAQAAQTARFGRISENLRRLSIKSVVSAATMTPIIQMIVACSLSTVIVIALWQSRTGIGTVGSFVAFIVAMLQLTSPIKHLSEVAGPITRGLAALDRGVALINDTPMEKSGGNQTERARGELELRDVTLRYAGEGHPPALDGVNLVLRPGETVALVGPSGSGKSSLVNLLPRFQEPTTGTLLLDGKPMHDWDVAALRRQFSMVSQDVILFNDTVMANVTLGHTDTDAQTTQERVRAALRAANLLDFVKGLPDGLTTSIGHNGNQLSGGQRQRLAIARAVYKDAPILILDEATSALDSESERLVQDALDALMKGRTSLVIAHRLSTIKAADRVAVLDQGRIVEYGTHAELLARKGLFAHLHALQFKS